MITERTLRRWRKEALCIIENSTESNEYNYKLNILQAGRTLKMTQELLDQHLLRREK